LRRFATSEGRRAPFAGYVRCGNTSRLSKFPSRQLKDASTLSEVTRRETLGAWSSPNRRVTFDRAV
jgi:hypothetical protein